MTTTTTDFYSEYMNLYTRSRSTGGYYSSTTFGNHVAATYSRIVDKGDSPKSDVDHSEFMKVLEPAMEVNS